MDREVFISRQKRRFIFVVNVIQVVFPILTLTWRVNISASRQGKVQNRTNESTTVNNVKEGFSIWPRFDSTDCD